MILYVYPVPSATVALQHFFRRHSLNASSRRIFTNTERYTYLLFMEKHFIYRDKLREKDGTIIR
ncbi:hypothetical protein QSI_2827 [Clostridioides difficile P28]|nr:hypothetical protein QSI_2827 [Clostridioides difficile P28]